MPKKDIIIKLSENELAIYRFNNFGWFAYQLDRVYLEDIEDFFWTYHAEYFIYKKRLYQVITKEKVFY